MAILDLQKSNARFIKEASIRCEDVFRDDDELKISKAIYNRIKDSIYASMSRSSRSKYYRITYNTYNNQNIKLTLNKQKITQNGYLGFLYSVATYMFGKLYKLNVFLHINTQNDSNIEEFAAYNTQTNTLFLPLLNDDLTLNSRLFLAFENSSWIITHEMTHKLDFDNMIFAEDDFIDAQNSVKNEQEYYNNEPEFSAHSKELMHFVLDCFMSYLVGQKSELDNFSNPEYVKEAFDYIFNNKYTVMDRFQKIADIKKDPYTKKESYSLSVFYNALTDKNKTRLANDFAERVDKIIKPKYEDKNGYKEVILQILDGLYDEQ